MSRSAYYEDLKQLARDVREQYGFVTPKVSISDLRRIYKDEDVRIDLWPHKLKSLRGAYFNDRNGASVMICKLLPDEPRIFTMGHELKHHLVDSDLQVVYCDQSNELEAIEIGAEVFSAELIYPEDLFAQDVLRLGIVSIQPEDLVRLKATTKTTMSYAALVKRATRLGLAPAGVLNGIQWKKLEEKIFGEPIYKRVQRARASRA